MKNNLFLVFIAVGLSGIIVLLIWQFAPNSPTGASNTLESQTPAIAIVAENLQIPWDIAFLPDGTMLATERPGRVVHIESGRVFSISGVVHRGEGGLLGIALHPNFEENNFVYLYQTTSTNGALQNRVARYVYQDDELNFDRVILDGIPGATNHDGGRIEFGPDAMLYVTAGDAGNEDTAQNRDTLSGSVLRIDDNGSIPETNPFGNAIYSYGHRNPQGLAWDSNGRLWGTEHGRSGILSGYDEINLIQISGNYGWPDCIAGVVLYDSWIDSTRLLVPRRTGRHGRVRESWHDAQLQLFGRPARNANRHCVPDLEKKV